MGILKSSTNEWMLSFFSLAFTCLGGFPILVVCIMMGKDHLSIKHMMWKSRKREKKMEETMETLGSGNRHEQSRVVKNLDLSKEHFHGRYHRATLFDIAAHSGTVLFKQA